MHSTQIKDEGYVIKNCCGVLIFDKCGRNRAHTRVVVQIKNKFGKISKIAFFT